jgi:hypothetical protein
MPVIAGDTFVEATTDTDIAAHVPTGANAGKAWNYAGAGNILVKTGTNLATENDTTLGSRARMDNDLGSDEMDVSGDFTIAGGTAVLPGLLGRLTSSGGTSTNTLQFGYSQGSGQWQLQDNGGVLGLLTLTEAWPGGTVTMLMVVRRTGVRCYANGVLKISSGVPGVAVGKNYAGIVLSSFDGGVPQLTCDNFLAVGVPGDGARVSEYRGQPMIRGPF